MIQFPLAPGVYVDEPATLSLSVGQAATAVPVIVVGPAATEPWWEVVKKPLLISSFSEYLRYLTTPPGRTSSGRQYSGNQGLNRAARHRRQGPGHWPTFATLAKSGLSGVSSAGGIDWHRPFAPALKAYFDNGGGYCYLCPSDQLAAVQEMSDVTLVVQAGQVGVGNAILAVCKPGSGLFGLLDGPETSGAFDAVALTAFVNGLAPSDHAALYYPWLKPDWLLYTGDGVPVTDIHHVAPSAVVAGLICATDSQTGPWKAPANIPARGGLKPTVRVGDHSQKGFTDTSKTKISVNMIREFDGRGTQIWGARTMTVSGNAWAYIPVRRTFDMVERDVSAALEVVLFEPNGQATWEVVRAATDSYLYNLWNRGAFSGLTPATSYFIQVGAGITMSQSDIDNGILRVRVGIAVVRPAEFIIIEFIQQVASGE